VIAAILLGEGWHNNHYHPRAANHGTRRTAGDQHAILLEQGVAFSG
jgi:fatty-acid desaturase